MNKKIIEFLTDLKQNNNRDWFKSHKDYYDEARNEFIVIIENLIPALAVSNPEIANLQVKDTIFRIYRDVRFSADKSPYKTQMGAYMASGGRKSPSAGYYLHIEPGNSFVAGGSYTPQAENLKKIRSEIFYNIEEFKSIIESVDFKELFSEINGDKLKRPPVGFSKDFKDIDLLKFKSYTIFHPVKDSFIESPKFIENAISIFEKVKPFNDFLNRAIS